ncbi:hypothetical protein MRX96_057483 [Rhipicephalus microplus]
MRHGVRSGVLVTAVASLVLAELPQQKLYWLGGAGRHGKFRTMPDDNASPIAALPTLISLPPPPQFNFENPGEWRQWIFQFEDYGVASGLYKATDEVKVGTPLYTIGSQEARHTLET